MRKKVIGTIGKNASGKDTVLEILSRKYEIPLISIGDIARDIARDKGVEPTRENLHEVSRSHFEKYGTDYFIKIVVERIDASPSPVVLVAGVRTYLDVRTLRERYGEDFLLIHVLVTDESVRLGRALGRASARDPKGLQELLAQDASEEELFGAAKAASMASSVLTNDGTLRDLEDRVEAWVADHVPEIRGRGA
jgi:dephospho-CoA kinase